MAEKKADIRRKQILEKLISQESVSYDYIMEHFNISERSMQQDIKELIKQGYDIKGVKAHRGYVLRNEKKSEYYEPANAKNIRMLYILEIIWNHKDGITLDEIYDAMTSNSDIVETVANKKTLVTTVEDMVSKKIVKKNRNRYVISVNAPVRLAMSTSRAMDTLNVLETFSKGDPFEETLLEVKRKLLIALFNDDEDEDEAASDYVVYKKDYSTAGKLPEYLTELNTYPFENKQLYLTYKTNDGAEIHVSFSIGNIVYSVDKDRLYLIGENEENTPMIIHYDSIKSIEVSDETNCIFQNEFYTSIVNDMFSISLDQPSEVEVVFDNVFRIKEKLQRVVSNRVNATLTDHEDKLIYKDRISGLYDFAGYLRRFGSACEVISPPELRQMMKNTAVRTLEAYKSLSEGGGDIYE